MNEKRINYKFKTAYQRYIFNAIYGKLRTNLKRKPTVDEICEVINLFKKQKENEKVLL